MPGSWPNLVPLPLPTDANTVATVHAVFICLDKQASSGHCGCRVCQGVWLQCTLPSQPPSSQRTTSLWAMCACMELSRCANTAFPLHVQRQDWQCVSFWMLQRVCIAALIVHIEKFSVVMRNFMSCHIHDAQSQAMTICSCNH